jgi:mannose-6-phosphate isomerase-like protein (cupin superfamily)
MSTTARTILAPDEGELVHLFALGVRFMLDGPTSGGNCSLVEYRLPPHTLGAPLHTHHGEDEFSFVVAGRLGVQLGDDELEAGPGELVAKPRDIPHTFWNPGDEPTRVLDLISPAGFENYFRDLAPVLAAAGPGAPEVMEIAARYDFEIDFSTVPVLAERHGLRLGD